VKLGDLLSRVPGAALHGPPGVDIHAVTHDSRKASALSLFVAIRGLVADGNGFVDAALRKGAAAIVSEAAPRAGVPWIQVPDAREALALLSAAVLGHPADSLELVGITGTNGKTTTAYLVDAALRAAGHRSSLLGTIQYRIGDQLTEAVRTTPESSDLQGLFREMLDANSRYAVMEVSSHSLALKRVYGCHFRVAVFTNLTRDHLDFHGDMEAYFAAKRVLFDTLLREDGHAILNADDDRAGVLQRVSRGHVWTYALDRDADLRAEEVALSLEGTRLRVTTPVGELDVRSPLVGRFNAQNILAALGAALALGVPAEAALRGIASVAQVPGRLERVATGQDFSVVVDYAHTDDALRNLLEAVRELKPRRIITVFGCGGDRDRTKRPLMGNVASRLSDVAVVTSDNPRSEPPEAIIEDILRGMGRDAQAQHHVIVDRRDAIARALELAGPGDVVVVAGKGHETYQVLRDRSIPFDDRQVVRDLVRRLPVKSGKA
jgi:UDP-N-acetylmuramoyl-L-alanyl-D-glutamate--2,6-diaminopimelate ligase